MSNWRVRLAARSAAWTIWREQPALLLRIELRVQQQRGAALDDREQVVEIVRHAAGQLSERLHFLGLAELIFQQ